MGPIGNQSDEPIVPEPSVHDSLIGSILHDSIGSISDLSIGLVDDSYANVSVSVIFSV